MFEGTTNNQGPSKTALPQCWRAVRALPATFCELVRCSDTHRNPALWYHGLLKFHQISFSVYEGLGCFIFHTFPLDSFLQSSQMWSWVASCPASSSAVASTCSPPRCHGSAWRVSHIMVRKFHQTWCNVLFMQHGGRYASNKRNYNDASTLHGFTNGNASLCIEQLLGQLCLNASCVVKK